MSTIIQPKISPTNLSYLEKILKQINPKIN